MRLDVSRFLRARALVAAAAAASALTAACGGGGGSGATVPTVPTAEGQAEAPAATPSEAPADEGPTDPDPADPDSADPDSVDVDPDPVDERAAAAGQDEPAPEAPEESEPPATTEPPPPEPAGPPHAAELAWGNFELSERIAAKLASGERLNFVVSLAATGETTSAESFEHGWSQAAAGVLDRYGAEVNARVVGPNQADAAAQAETIESLIGSGDIDCLAVEASGPTLMLDAIDAAIEAGVPVLAVGGDTPDSKRFAFYGNDDLAAGRAAGSLVGNWARDGGILVQVAGLLTGDAGDQRLFDRMRGFVAGFSEVHPGVVWVNTPVDADSYGFEQPAVYDAVEAWVLANSDADIVFHTDRGLEPLAAVMADQLLYGDMYAVGFHMNDTVADYIRERLVAAAFVQNASEQARRAGMACGDFLLGGVHDTGHVVVEPVAVTRDNVDEVDWSLPENL